MTSQKQKEMKIEENEKKQNKQTPNEVEYYRRFPIFRTPRGISLFCALCYRLDEFMFFHAGIYTLVFYLTEIFTLIHLI